MSDKLKVMQEPMTRNAAQLFGLDFVTYQFSTIDGRNYFVEVHLHEGLLGAIARLKATFGIEANSYCPITCSPKIVKIEVVDVRHVPAQDGERNFVSLIYPSHPVPVAAVRPETQVALLPSKN